MFSESVRKVLEKENLKMGEALARFMQGKDIIGIFSLHNYEISKWIRESFNGARFDGRLYNPHDETDEYDNDMTTYDAILMTDIKFNQPENHIRFKETTTEEFGKNFSIPAFYVIFETSLAETDKQVYSNFVFTYNGILEYKEKCGLWRMSVWNWKTVWDEYEEPSLYEQAYKLGETIANFMKNKKSIGVFPVQREQKNPIIMKWLLFNFSDIEYNGCWLRCSIKDNLTEKFNMDIYDGIILLDITFGMENKIRFKEVNYININVPVLYIHYELWSNEFDNQVYEGYKLNNGIILWKNMNGM